MNNTLYHFSRVTTDQKWREATPADFKIVLKANRYFTHESEELRFTIEATSDLVSFRLHGPLVPPYREFYSKEALHVWAGRIHDGEHEGREAYLFFDHKMFGDAITNALDLEAIVNLKQRKKTAA